MFSAMSCSLLFCSSLLEGKAWKGHHHHGVQNWDHNTCTLRCFGYLVWKRFTILLKPHQSSATILAVTYTSFHLQCDNGLFCWDWVLFVRRQGRMATWAFSKQNIVISANHTIFTLSILWYKALHGCSSLAHVYSMITFLQSNQLIWVSYWEGKSVC